VPKTFRITGSFHKTRSGITSQNRYPLGIITKVIKIHNNYILAENKSQGAPVDLLNLPVAFSTTPEFSQNKNSNYDIILLFCFYVKFTPKVVIILSLSLSSSCHWLVTVLSLFSFG